MTSRSVSVVLPVEWVLTANGRYHHMVRANRTRHIREAFAHAADGIAPLTPPVTAEYQLEFKRGHRRDSPNWAPMFKAALDGFATDAGVLPDDDDRHVRPTVIQPHEVDNQLPAQHIRLTITLTEAPQ
ncbi:hypothetical protein RDI86_01960 [Cellulosimicrobium sp. XJ-DQ-B-000]|uniref:hypothetical protein n=1 Tax=Cellulosimicrobium sp. XJ-DQ-B-000 TaxID=3072182 RepID=UPI002806E611|nr:hypothetical protein [Cellulosimicrobium sp. XJ-DQ-B-000]MDQ8040612.1 hypothetical protein [Cellulosimicrobium sp. XJ-DQ-B-000]